MEKLPSGQLFLFLKLDNDLIVLNRYSVKTTTPLLNTACNETVQYLNPMII